MTSTALVVYIPPEPDAGRGLAFKRGWLISSPSARHVRWLAPWIQAVISNLYCGSLTFLRIPAVRSYIGITVLGLMVSVQIHLAMSGDLAAYLFMFIDYLAAIQPFMDRWCGHGEMEVAR